MPPSPSALSARPTLAEINAALVGLGLPRIPQEKIALVLQVEDRARIVAAIDRAPRDAEAWRFLADVLSAAGIGSEAEPALEQPDPRMGNSSVHVYGGRFALCFEADTTRQGFPTVALDATNADGPMQYDWSQKIRLQLTRAEMPVVTAVLLGVLPGCEFKNHGQDKDKGFSLERQKEGRVYVKVFAREQGVKGVPIIPADLFFVSALFIRQLQKACPWMNATSLVELIKLTQPMPES
ncbi:hypothetical protein [Azotobacter beijerinckii]|uniref:hypothetical protein n=1 Tax=Azotobacter beijerinckii TaxID=170623 RepID=UPI0029546D90|nr:hypothetical protein [Azotobacter beijerinckii]MDV7213032.1 hypothetical protein [Azotobacter beijerinckii]